MKIYIKKLKGKKAENFAVKFLKSHDYKILKRNFTCKTGEIDIIAFDLQSKELVFIEVRYRKKGIDEAMESINPAKQHRILRAAKFFLIINPLYEDFFLRFDVIALSHDQNNKWLIKHIKDAFRN